MDKKDNVSKGLLFALLSIPIAVVGWLILWQLGFIASIVPLASAAAAVWLYKKGAGTENTKPGAAGLLGIIVVGVVLAFLSGIVADAWAAYTAELPETTSLFDSGFTSFLTDNMFMNGELWSSYLPDLGISIVFAVLGASGVVMDLFKPAGKQEPEKTAAK